MGELAAIPLAEIVGSAVVEASAVSAVVPVIGIGAIVGVGLTLVMPKIVEYYRRDETVDVPRAPVQHRVGSKIILRDELVVEIEEAIKHAQIALQIDIKVAETKKSSDSDSPRAHVASGIRNAQHRTLKLYISGSFSGEFVVEPPMFMLEGPRSIGLFLHQGSDRHSGESKGYVIYGTDEDRTRPLLLYILAWSKPAKGSPKVYVQAGLLPNMLKQPYNSIKHGGQLPNQDEDQIIQKLSQLLVDKIRQTLNKLTEANQCSSYDPETGAEAAAKIRSVYPGSSWALLGATFSRREH